MSRFWKVGPILLVACFTSACDSGPETVERCIARLQPVSEKMPASASRVDGTYTFDLSDLTQNQLEQLGTAGLGGEGRPMFMATNQSMDALRKRLEETPVGPRGLLIAAQSSVLFRVPKRSHQSASDAVQEGCSLIPGAKLQAVALTSG